MSRYSELFFRFLAQAITQTSIGLINVISQYSGEIGGSLLGI
jgi:hypothetical protein